MDTSWSAAVLVGGRARRLDGRAKPLIAIDDLSVRVVDEADVRAFDPDGRLLLNVNTPDDLRRAAAPGPHQH